MKGRRKISLIRLEWSVDQCKIEYATHTYFKEQSSTNSKEHLSQHFPKIPNIVCCFPLLFVNGLWKPNLWVRRHIRSHLWVTGVIEKSDCKKKMRERVLYIHNESYRLTEQWQNESWVRTCQDEHSFRARLPTAEQKNSSKRSARLHAEKKPEVLSIRQVQFSPQSSCR